MSTGDRKPSLELALGSLPTELSKRVLKSYKDLKTRSLEGHFDAIGVRAGRLAEVLLRVLQQLLTGSYTPLSTQLHNFKGECERIEQLPSGAGPESLRILMPRALIFMYTLRNKRDFGHSGGEVEANEIDATTATRVADWCMCDLVRVCHKMPIEAAQQLCDAIAERSVPQLWSVLGKKRVLATFLTYPEQVLFLLYSELEKGVAIEDLFEWIEHPHPSNFRRDVMAKLHSTRQLEWDRETEMAILSPLGIQAVEQSILPKVAKGGRADA